MIEVRDLTKTFWSRGTPQLAVDSVSFECPKGSMLTLLGPSGSGKSTTLRCIAGLEMPDEGTIRIGDRLVQSHDQRVNLPPAKREIGMVFQSYAIWPHMSVYENVEYPLKRRHVRRQERHDRVMSALNLVELGELAQRPAPHLSGGQQQRVALARAIVGEPEVLLLDEPLSNLDAKLRRQLATYLRGLQQRLDLTAIYVTHDQEEALVLADTVALMQDGKIMEMEEPEEIYARPATLFGAGFLGDANLFSGEVTAVDQVGGTAVTEIGALSFVAGRSRPYEGLQVSVMVRPEKILLRGEQPATTPPDSTVVTGAVRQATFLGDIWEFEVEVSDGLVVKVKSQNPERLDRDSPASVIFERDNCIGIGRPREALNDVSVDAHTEEVLKG